MSLKDWIRAVEYVRTSTTMQEASIAEQLAWGRRIGAEEHIEIVAEFPDEGIPGDELIRRKGLQALFAFVEAEQRAGRPVACLLVWDLDRLSRADSVKTAVIIDRLREAGVTRAYTQEGWVDLNDEITITLNHIKQDFGRRGYSKSLSKNVTRSCLERAKRGEWCGGKPPYSYRTGGDKHLALDESDGGIRPQAVRWIFEWAWLGWSLRQIANELNRRGVPPSEANGFVRSRQATGVRQWTPRGVRVILANPLYTGDMHYGRRSRGKYHCVVDGAVVSRTRRRGPTGTLIEDRNTEDHRTVKPDAHPQLVDRQLFAAVQVKLATNAPSWKPGGRSTYKWLFSGMLRCGHCGEVMWGTNEHGERGYICSTFKRYGKGCHWHFAPEDQLLRLVAIAIRDHFSDPSVRIHLDEQMRLQQRATEMETTDVLPRWSQRAAELKSLIAQGSARLAKVPEDLLEGLVVEIRAWKQELSQVQAEIAAAKVRKQTGCEVADLVAKGLARLDQLPAIIEHAKADPALVRQVIRSLVCKIELGFAAPDGPWRAAATAYKTTDGKELEVYHDNWRKRRKFVLSHGAITTTPVAQALGIADSYQFSNVYHGDPCCTLLASGVTIRFSAA